MSQLIRRDAAAYAFLVPWAAGLILLVVAPLGWSLYLSFTDYDLLSTPEWVGFGNYLELFTEDGRFLHSILITGGYVLVAVPLQLAAALLLVKERRGKGLYRSLFYLPSLLAASVAVSITWRAMFDYGGPVNGVLGWFGVDERSWINNPSTVIWTTRTRRTTATSSRRRSARAASARSGRSSPWPRTSVTCPPPTNPPATTSTASSPPSAQ
ncbi:sugar ABC transporter permease [Nonomuraea sp. NPDC052116]|uniref:carbohydrate ABC transporter permease n=1 Tax=Nonomuraea sp. NPDC052116 TaxID=3155665 RepID=UPI003426DC6F